MRRVLPVVLAAITFVVWTIGIVILSWGPTASIDAATGRDCNNSCSVTDTSGQGGNPTGGQSLSVPSQKEAYCAPDSEFPGFHSVRLPQFLTASDTSIGSLNVGFNPQEYVPTAVVIPDIAIAQSVYQWCSGPTGTSKGEYFWVPLATPDSVALQHGLLAKVQGRLKMPAVAWLDIDLDHGWLWVNLDHHVGIDPPVPVSESASDGNPVTGYATAWVKATPVSFSIELPAESGVKSTQLAGCDLAAVTSGKGCEVKFTHSSSITDDGWFEGVAQIKWEVSSNSGKYNGVGPFTTSSEVRFQVAESMAVSRSGG